VQLILHSQLPIKTSTQLGGVQALMFFKDGKLRLGFSAHDQANCSFHSLACHGKRICRTNIQFLAQL